MVVYGDVLDLQECMNKQNSLLILITVFKKKEQNKMPFNNILFVLVLNFIAHLTHKTFKVVKPLINSSILAVECNCSVP